MKLSSLLLACLVPLACLATPALADGLIVVHNPPSTVPGHFSFAPLEVVYHKVDCQITDQVAVTSVDQDFYNPNGGRPLEGEYIFPIPKDAQINKFAMDIDGKSVEAELLPAEKARKIYEDIVRASKDPALLEYAGRAMFKVRIFPIDPNGHKRITLKYTEFLKQDANLLDYHYTLNTEKFSSKPLKNVSVKVTVNTTTPITTLYSPTHEVDTKRHNDTSAVVGFEAKDIRPDTDFHLFIGRKAAPVGLSVLTYKPEAGKEGYFVMMAAPTLSKDVKAQPKDVVFVLDTSGSMSGAKIEQAKKALKFCVNTMNKDDRFEIVQFSTEAEPFFKALAPYTNENRDKALKFIEDLQARGGTAIEDATAAALKLNTQDKARMFMVVFLTDGQPTIGEQNPDKLLAQAKKLGDGVRIFSFGIGTDVNTKLLDLMAEQTRGYSQYVLPNEDIEVSVSNFFGKVQDPVLAGLKLDVANVNVTKLYPKALPDLFKGDQLVIFGSYDKAAKTAVVLKGMVNGKEETFAQDVVFADKTDASNEWIGKLWATRRVGYLLDEIRLHGESKEIKDEVVELARKWGVVTPYTAMLIIEDERKRSVPVASRSLREMETDRVAVGSSVSGLSTLREEKGSFAVNNTINNESAKKAMSLSAAENVGAQFEGRLRAGNKDGKEGFARADLDKSDAGRDQVAKATASPAAPGLELQGSHADSSQMIAHGAGGAATTPYDAAIVPTARVSGRDLNLGNQNSQNGWNYAAQNDKEKANATGYRIVNNYAQQNRVINNRAFYLNGNQWTDTQAQKAQAEKAKTTKIKFGSDDYFKLLRDHPDAAQFMALGNNITFEIAGTVYDIVDEESAPATTNK